ncbi:Amino acid permease 8 [Apostasia shenzhenica]|uniref:Amino acid permease 8 n=1 Tax=Apostasia shenzhenica TaxID=1088818 RepID=A0A2I0B6J6_9ASPA|nr:Amino acid permease 8 [Apostasia shenzhenica]
MTQEREAGPIHSLGMSIHPSGGSGAGSAVREVDDDGRPRRTGTASHLPPLLLHLLLIWISPLSGGDHKPCEKLSGDRRVKLSVLRPTAGSGTVWTASAHIITAVIGSGVLSLSWSMAQLGWAIGPSILLAFAGITLYTSSLLADCYRNSDHISGKRNYNYMSAVKSNLGAIQIWLCGLCQYVNLCGTAVGYTVTASISAAAINKSHCFHSKGHEADCRVSNNIYMVAFGICQIFFSQLPDFHNLWWLSILAAIMSFTYSLIGVGLALARVVAGNNARTYITGTIIGVDVTAAEKVWNTFQALGDIAFAYSYSMILIEIQDTIKSPPPPENEVMKKASLIGVVTTTVFYMLCGCLGYKAFGNKAPGNMLTGFGFYEPFWLIDIANICIVVHLLGAYQVYCQPVFAVVENRVNRMWPNLKILTNEIYLINRGRSFQVKINIFRLFWRSAFVVTSTVLAIVLPFFNDIMGFLGAVGFWPLTVYFPIEMYVRQKKIPRLSTRGIALQILSFCCLLVSLAAAIGSIEGVMVSLKTYKPFHTKS